MCVCVFAHTCAHAHEPKWEAGVQRLGAQGGQEPAAGAPGLRRTGKALTTAAINIHTTECLSTLTTQGKWGMDLTVLRCPSVPTALI